MTFHKYVVTAQKPTATQFAVKGLFTSPHETNLILGYVFATQCSAEGLTEKHAIAKEHVLKYTH